MIQLLVRGAGASAKRHIAERPAHSLKCYVEHIMKKRPDGTGAVTNPAVTVTRTAGSVTVTVTGESPAVIPGLTQSVSATSTSPIEEFKP